MARHHGRGAGRRPAPVAAPVLAPPEKEEAPAVAVAPAPSPESDEAAAAVTFECEAAAPASAPTGEGEPSETAFEQAPPSEGDDEEAAAVALEDEAAARMASATATMEDLGNRMGELTASTAAAAGALATLRDSLPEGVYQRTRCAAPGCGSEQTGIHDTRTLDVPYYDKATAATYPRHVRRVHECHACGQRFYTRSGLGAEGAAENNP